MTALSAGCQAHRWQSTLSTLPMGTSLPHCPLLQKGTQGPRQDSTSDGRRMDPWHTTGPMPLGCWVSASEGGDALVVGTGPKGKQQEFPMSAPRRELRGCSPGRPCAGRSWASVGGVCDGPRCHRGPCPCWCWECGWEATSGLHELYCSCQDFHLTSIC